MTKRESPSPGLILAVISFGVFVAADDLTVVSTMLRQIIFDLQIPLPEGLNDAAWIVNAYLIAYVIVMPFIGRVSDIIGRRLVYIGSLSLFLLGSIWIPLADDLPTFIVGRVLTALGGGAMVPVGMAIIGDIYPPEKRPSALGTLGAVDTLGWIWGPLYGALLIRFLNWRWQFYLNIPLSFIGIVAAWYALAKLPVPPKRGRIDWVGTTFLTAGLLSLSIALLNNSNIQSVNSLAELSGESQDNGLPLFLISLICFLTFFFIEREINRDSGILSKLIPADTVPILDPALIKRANFRPAILVNFLVGAVLIIAMVNVPLLINILEVDVEKAALKSGWLLSAMTASMAVLAYFGGRLTERFGYRPVTIAGICACVIGFSLMGFTWSPESGELIMAAQLMILGVGFGLVIAPISSAVINTAPIDQRGIASSLVIVLRLIGMSVGLSALTAWGLNRFNNLRSDIVLPPIGSPNFQDVLMSQLTSITVEVMTETFLLSALIVAFALFAAWRLRNEPV